MSGAIDLTALEGALDAAAPEAERAGLSEDQRRALGEARRPAGGGRLPALVARAVAAVDAQRNLEGARLALRAVKEHPDCLQGYVAGAVALDRLGFLAEALAFYEQAVARAPRDPTICALLGATALRARQTELAEKFYRLASQLDPSSTSHVNNLAGVLRDLGRFDDAITLLRNRLYLSPEAAVLWNTLGTVVQEQGDPETAATFLAEAMRLDPRLASAPHNLGGALNDLGRFDEACEALDAALALVRSPADRAEMTFARAQSRLGAGRIEEGWADYEARLDARAQDATLIAAPVPRWRVGEPLAGKRLMVIGEQGLGDEVLFASVLPEAIEAAGAVTIACQARLVGLFSRSFPQARVVAHATAVTAGRLTRLVRPEHWAEIDLWTPMADLARAWRRSLGDFPGHRSFLHPDPARIAQMDALVAAAPGVRVGIVWKSMVMTPKRARFFAPFPAWAPVLQVPGASFHCLQYGEIGDERRYAEDKLGVSLRRIEGLDVKDDLEGVAAAAQALDLVIGPMNANANLAAACGREVWLIERYGSWPMLGAPDMPWYPHARVFRVGADGQWRSLFSAMADALRGRVAARAAAA
jgi:tetratricopeptide (TPR) repeat protein